MDPPPISKIKSEFTLLNISQAFSRLAETGEGTVVAEVREQMQSGQEGRGLGHLAGTVRARREGRRAGEI